MNALVMAWGNALGVGALSGVQGGGRWGRLGAGLVLPGWSSG